MKTSEKDIVSLLTVVIVSIIMITGCTATRAVSDAEKPELEEIAEKLYADIDVPAYEIVKLDKTNFEYFTFIPYDESLSAVAADALVNITPHSMVVIRTENKDGKALAEEILEKADPNKWLCVGSEAVYVVYTDNYVVLIMSEKVTADAIANNFKDMAKELDDMEMQQLTKENTRYEW